MSTAKREKLRPAAEGATVSDLHNIPVTEVKVNHLTNTSRAAIYDTPAELVQWLGPKCCFTLAEIEERLNGKDGLAVRGQMQPVSVYLTNTGVAHLVFGYLRHAALLLAQVRGVDVPGAAPARGDKSVLRLQCKVVKQPKSQADWLKLAMLNTAENDARKPTTAVDKAFAIKALLNMTDDEGNSPSIADVATLMSPPIGESMARRYLSLLELPPHKLREVHEGKLAMSQALANKSAEGQGSATGPRAGIKRKSISRALTTTPAERPRPTGSLSAKQVEALLAAVIGDDVNDEKVAEWVKWANAPKPERAPKPDATETKPRRTKKAPPKLGEKPSEENDA